MADFLKKTVFSVHTRADANMKSQQLWQHAQDLHKLKPKNPNMEKGK